MKKIAFICEYIGTKRQGGDNIAMIRVANSLKKFGFSVDIFTYTNQDQNFKINSLIPLKLRMLPFIREMFFSPIIGHKLLKQLENKYDAILASTTTISSIYKPRTNLLIICHIIRSQKFQKLSKLPKYKILFNPAIFLIMSTLEKMSFKNAKKIIVIREQQKKYLQDKFGIDESKIHVIPNGIDIHLFKPEMINKKNQIIFVGRGTIPKGIDTLLNAADSINAKILIVTQKIDDKFLNIAKQKQNVVLKHSATPTELVKLYSESKVFVLPSLDEEQPLSTLEAMSCGLPVVVTKEGAGDFVKTEINGFIIPEHNPEELSVKVNKLLHDEKLRNKIGLKNREYIIHNYNLVNTILTTSKLIYA